MADERKSTVPTFPPDAYSDDGVDLTLIRWMLSLTPMERLMTLQTFAQFAMGARHAVESARLSTDDSHSAQTSS
jgi:hypothetical protein